MKKVNIIDGIGIGLLIALLLLVVYAIDEGKKGTYHRDNFRQSKPKAELSAENAGYEVIRNHGYVPFMCSEDDSILTSSKLSVVKNGTQSEISVCCGLIKGCSIRY